MPAFRHTDLLGEVHWTLAFTPPPTKGTNVLAIASSNLTRFEFCFSAYENSLKVVYSDHRKIRNWSVN